MDFNTLYLRTDPSFQPYALKSKLWKRKKWASFADLPSDESVHIRGFAHSGFQFCRFVVGDDHEAVLPRLNGRSSDLDPIKPIIFHAQPTSGLYSDIPSWLDVYEFLNWRHRDFIMIGRKFVSWIYKSERTLRLIRRLFDWEDQHPYKLSRLERISKLDLAERFARSALRGSGIRLPSRPSTAQNKWPEVFTSAGIEVEQIDRGSRSK